MIITPEQKMVDAITEFIDADGCKHIIKLIDLNAVRLTEDLHNYADWLYKNYPRIKDMNEVEVTELYFKEKQ